MQQAGRGLVSIGRVVVLVAGMDPWTDGSDTPTNHEVVDKSGRHTSSYQILPR